MYFANNQEIDDYVAQKNYAYLSAARKTLCFGVVFNKHGANNQYEYMLRFNVSSYDDKDLPDTSDLRIRTVSL